MSAVHKVLIRSQTKGRSMFYAKKLKFTLQSVSQKCHIESCILEVYSGSRVSGEGELDKTGKRGGRWKRKEPVRKYDRSNKAG